MPYVDELDMIDGRNFIKAIVHELKLHLPVGYVSTEDIVVKYTIRYKIDSFVTDYVQFEKAFIIGVPQLWEFKGITVQRMRWSPLDCVFGPRWEVKMRIQQRLLFAT